MGHDRARGLSLPTPAEPGAEGLPWFRLDDHDGLLPVLPRPVREQVAQVVQLLRSWPAHGGPEIPSSDGSALGGAALQEAAGTVADLVEQVADGPVVPAEHHEVAVAALHNAVVLVVAASTAEGVAPGHRERLAELATFCEELAEEVGDAVLRRVVPRGDGTYRLRFGGAERELLRRSMAELRELLVAGDDPALRRLAPPAYPTDEEHEAQYRAMAGDDLLAGRLDAIEVVESTLDATQLDQEQLLRWMGCINDVRLVLGTRLDVTEDDPGPPPGTDQLWDAYRHLTTLLGHVVRALSSGR